MADVNPSTYKWYIKMVDSKARKLSTIFEWLNTFLLSLTRLLGTMQIKGVQQLRYTKYQCRQ